MNILVRSTYLSFLSAICLHFFSACTVDVNTTDPNLIQQDLPINYYHPVPKPEQILWQEDKLGMFVHFGMNTMTNKEIGDGNESPTLFNPVNIDVNQWVNIAKAAGFKLIVLTAKHVDGFCLWPSDYTEYSVKNSPWQNGNGDLVKDLSDACKTAGLKFGFYLALWDRHEPTYGSNQYNDFFVNQLTELLTNYGEITEVWLDGANFDTVHQWYDWQRYITTVKDIQPRALIANMGPDIRWIGNESGLGEETEWCSQNPWIPMHGDVPGKVWFPSECDVSIRPGWFWHSEEDNQVKSVETLLDIYFSSVGRNSNLLLNVPPNSSGMIAEQDVIALTNWKSEIDQIFANDIALDKNVSASNTRGNVIRFNPENCTDGNPDSFWSTDDGINTGFITIDLINQHKFNIIKLEEAIQYGQRINIYKVEALIYGSWEEISSGTTVGRTKIDYLNQPVTTNKVRITIEDALSNPAIRTVSLNFKIN